MEIKRLSQIQIGAKLSAKTTPSEKPSQNTRSNPSQNTSQNPSQNPSPNTSENPSQNATEGPSVEPTLNPTGAAAQIIVVSLMDYSSPSLNNTLF